MINFIDNRSKSIKYIHSHDFINTIHLIMTSDFYQAPFVKEYNSWVFQCLNDDINAIALKF